MINNNGNVIREYDKKREEALSFYKNGNADLIKVENSIIGFAAKNGFSIFNVPDSLSEEAKEIMEGQKKSLMIDLGRIGENYLKYLLKLIQIYSYPNQSFSEYEKHSLYGIGYDNTRPRTSTYNFYQHDSNARNNYMDLSVKNNIVTAYNSNPKQAFHNYNYLFNVLKEVAPQVEIEIFNTIEFMLKKNISNEEFRLKFKKIREMADAGLDTLIDLDFDQIKIPDFSIDFLGKELETKDRNIEPDKLKDVTLETIEKNGDSFTVLRYINENPNNKTYDFNTAYELINIIQAIVNLVHNINKDDITKSIRKAHQISRYLEDGALQLNINPKNTLHQLLEKQKNDMTESLRAKYPQVSQQTIDLEHKIITERINNIIIERIKSLNESGISNIAVIIECIEFEITPEIIHYFYNKNIKDMEIIKTILTGLGFSIDNIQQLNLQEKEVYLLQWLDVTSLKWLQERSTVYEYILDNPEVLNNLVPKYDYSITIQIKNFNFMRAICDLKEIKKDPSLLACIHNNTSLNEPNFETEIRNIKENVDRFKNDPILYKLPLEYPTADLQRRYNLLVSAGLTLDKIDSLPPSVFDMTGKFDYILQVLTYNNEPLFKNGSINKLYYYIENYFTFTREYEFAIPPEQIDLKMLYNQEEEATNMLEQQTNIMSQGEGGKSI